MEIERAGIRRGYSMCKGMEVRVPPGNCKSIWGGVSKMGRKPGREDPREAGKGWAVCPGFKCLCFILEALGS